jgi:hypothetical protein
MGEPITFHTETLVAYPLRKERIQTLARDSKVGVIKFDPPLSSSKAMEFTVAVREAFGPLSVVFIPEPQQWFCRPEMLE